MIGIRLTVRHVPNPVSPDPAGSELTKGARNESVDMKTDNRALCLIRATRAPAECESHAKAEAVLVSRVGPSKEARSLSRVGKELLHPRIYLHLPRNPWPYSAYKPFQRMEQGRTRDSSQTHARSTPLWSHSRGHRITETLHALLSFADPGSRSFGHLEPSVYWCGNGGETVHCTSGPVV